MDSKNPILIEEVQHFVTSIIPDESAQNRVLAFTQDNEAHSGGIMRSILTVFLTIVGSFFVTFSVFALMFRQLSPDVIPYGLMLFSCVMYFIPALVLIKKDHPLMGQTLLGLSVITAAFSISNTLLFGVWLVGCALAFFYSSSRFLAVSIYLFLSLGVAYKCFPIFSRIGDMPELVFALLNGLLFIGLSRVRQPSFLRQHYLVEPVRYTALILMFVVLFALTFSSQGLMKMALYNGLYFIFLTAAVVTSVKSPNGFYRESAFLAWIVFLVCKYYDLVWTFLDKSVALIVLGLIFLGIGFYFNKRTTEHA